MSPTYPALRRTGLGALAGIAAGALVALQGLEGWALLATAGMVLAPVPLVIAAVRGRALAAFTSLALLTLVVGATPAGRATPAWGIAVGYGGVVAYVLLVAHWLQAFNIVLFSGVTLATGLACLHLAASAHQHGRTPAAEYADILATVETELGASPAMNEGDEARREQLQAALPIVKRLLPAIAVGEYAASLALATWASLFALRRLRIVTVPRLDFGAWRLPEWFVFVFIGPAVALLGALWQEAPVLQTVAGNLLLVVSGLYLLQGCAIVHAFLRRIRTRPLVEVFLFLSMFLLIPPVLLAVAVAGLFDFLVDFRGRWMPAAPGAPDERSDG